MFGDEVETIKQISIFQPHLKKAKQLEGDHVIHDIIYQANENGII